MTIQITPLTEPTPSRKAPGFFTERMDQTLSELPAAFTQMNALIVEMNALAAAAGYPNAAALAAAIADIIDASLTKNVLADADLFELRNSVDGELWNITWALLKTNILACIAALDSGWFALTLENGFTNYSGFITRCRKTSSGVVNVSATLANTGTRTAGTTVFTLPSGYRPTQTLRAPVTITGTGGELTYLLQIGTNGACQVYNATWPGGTVTGLNLSFIAG